VYKLFVLLLPPYLRLLACLPACLPACFLCLCQADDGTMEKEKTYQVF
jgi:hypothetical protein